MRPYKKVNLFFLLVLVTSFASCKKVIHVNLNSTSSRYVVQGEVTDQPRPYLVTITKSINFDQDNIFPTVSGALVVITDVTANISDTLAETSPGNYTSHLITGTSGHVYSMYVSVANNIFRAKSTMPSLVTLDSLYTQPSPFRADRPELVPVYTDPVATGNYYHFVEIKNDTVANAVIVRNDGFINGVIVKQPIGGDNLNPGDSVALFLECIDSAMYQYYFSLNQTEDQSSATPANPQSNITGGALGYFSAHTSSMKSIIVH